ncbi:MAG: MarR family transcriptional regulator [bacterium]|nr:MarR family transcriptional regulator [bacterium]
MDRKLSGPEQFIQEFGLVFEQFGVPRMPGRVMGYLLVCEPAEQTMGDMVKNLKAAKSSVSTALKMLELLSFVERRAYPGKRADYYRAAAHPWAASLQGSNMKFSIMRDLAQRGLQMLPEDAGRSRRMLEEMQELYAALEEEWPALVERVIERQRRRRQGGL